MGDALGCYNLGVAYNKGVGVAKDSSKAFAFTKKACDMGAAQGCANLGALYDNGGDGVKKTLTPLKTTLKRLAVWDTKTVATTTK